MYSVCAACGVCAGGACACGVCACGAWTALGPRLHAVSPKTASASPEAARNRFAFMRFFPSPGVQARGSGQGYAGAKKAIEVSRKKLGVDSIDLYLIHQPMGDYIGAYRAMEEACAAGKLRAIGVCNCYPHVLADICETVEIRPAVNQVELHPFFQQESALALMREYGVHPEAWGPFAEGKYGIFTHPVLTEIGRKYGKSAAQVALRWNVQRDVTVIPKSVHKERMEQNLDIWDFQLSGEDMAQIAKLDIGRSEIVDHSDPKFVQMLHQMKLHA